MEEVLKASGETFTLEQTEYLRGFWAGVENRRGSPFVGELSGGKYTNDAASGAANLAEPEPMFHGNAGRGLLPRGAMEVRRQPARCRVLLCGITGHKKFASDTGILVPPAQSVALAAAMIRVFNEHGDRTDRKKAG